MHAIIYRHSAALPLRLTYFALCYPLHRNTRSSNDFNVPVYNDIYCENFRYINVIRLVIGNAAIPERIIDELLLQWIIYRESISKILFSQIYFNKPSKLIF